MWIRVLVKYGPLDILTQPVRGRGQESSHLCAPQVQVGGWGPLDLVPGPHFENPSIILPPSPFVITGASFLLML